VRILRSFIKDGYGKPYIPGSSLKGALHTALWTGLGRDNIVSATRGYKKFSDEIKRLPGSSHEHFMRPVQVSDSHPVAFDGLMVCEVKFFNLKSSTSAGWKNFASSRRETVTDYKSAAGLYVEALKSGTKTCMQFSMDDFLLKEAVWRLGKIKRHSGLKDFSSLARQINQHSLHILRRELEFFARFPEGAEVARFYRDLGSKIQAVADEGGFVTRMAWGSGWRGMTGDWLDGAELEAVRKTEKLGKVFCPYCKSPSVKFNRRHGQYECRKCSSNFACNFVDLFPDFPKTRRLAVQGGVPCLPLGWIMVRAVKKSVFYSRLVAHESAKSDAGKKIEPTPKVKKEKVDLAKWRQQEMENFKKNIKPQIFVSAIPTYLEKIESVQDRELQQEMCNLLLQIARSLPNKKQRYDKAVKQGKKWAVSLKELCEKYGGS
jgi:CRISPR type III-A-associated RAMP protein Csm5